MGRWRGQRLHSGIHFVPVRHLGFFALFLAWTVLQLPLAWCDHVGLHAELATEHGHGHAHGHHHHDCDDHECEDHEHEAHERVELPAAFAVERLADSTPVIACVHDAERIVDARGLGAASMVHAPPGVAPAARAIVLLL